MAKKRRIPKSAKESPTTDCLLICDDVLISQGKQKHFLQGVVGQIVVRELPAMIGGYVAYVRLSNVYSQQKLRLCFLKADDMEEIFAFETETAEITDPLGVYTLILPIPAFRVESEGRYLFSAVHGGVAFAQSPIVIRTIQKNTNEVDME